MMGLLKILIIYMNLNCHYKSILENHQIKDKEKFTKDLCEKFLSNSGNKHTQNYIMFSYYDLKEKNEKYPINIDFLYNKNLGSIVRLE
jgi:hypothetical protein